MTKENFQVDLRGIVEILSHHLYSSPRVYVRELIQNARDAVVARLKIDPSLPARLGNRAPIEITVDGASRSVTIRDHGIGLTETDARNLLATIGASSKKQEFTAARRDYLGQFGIGLLSCFLVADEIEVRSRSAREPNSPTMRWVGYGDGTYSVTTAETSLAEPGTEIRVIARPDESEWVTIDRVELLARQFAGLLGFPIVVREPGRSTDDSGVGAGAGPGVSAADAGLRSPAQPKLVSMHTPPWELKPIAAAEWCAQEFGFAPLTSIPINIPTHGVRGIAFISGVDGDSRNRGGDFLVSNGMLVAPDNTQVVPDWATFARVVLEAGSLSLTASREALQDTGAVEHVRIEVGRQLRAGIERMVSQSPAEFEVFVNAHGTSLLGMAADDEQMLDFVARHLTWETSGGNLRLVEMPSRVLYAESRGDFSTYAPLVAARGGMLVNGSYVYGTRVLRGYDRAQQRLSLSAFELQQVIEDLPAPREEERELADRIRHLVEPVLSDIGVATELRSFSPESLMVLHVPARSTPFHFEDAEDDPWASLLSPDGLSAGENERDTRPRLVLNVKSAAVRALTNPLTTATRNDAIRALHLLGLLQAGQRLNAEEQAALARALQTLLLAASQPPSA
ncbi:MAG: HSP90 family protein [Gulosibacter sp.]|uniref:HSP90 family protein n=1 Tax=Gulosibacter sp. TaxID=2817531 RepID=UPI003F8DDE69